jgi:predicted glycosyltransferase
MAINSWAPRTRTECALDLLDRFDIPHVEGGRHARGAVGLVAEFGRRFVFTAKAARQFDTDYMLGLWRPVIALASHLMRGRSAVFYDNENARKATLRCSGLATCSVCYPVIATMPDRFQPDQTRLKQYGLGGDQALFMVRFASWEAAYDFGQSSLSATGKRELVEKLGRKGRALI